MAYSSADPDQGQGPVPHRGPAGHDDSVKVPTPAIVAVGLLLIASVLLVGLARISGIGLATPVSIDAQERYALLVTDGDDGSIDIRSAANGDLVHSYPAGEHGFVRVALSALVFDRQKVGIGSEVPFDLVLTESGQLYLTDPATDQIIPLGAFGGDNAASFQPLLAAARLNREGAFA